MDLSEEKNLITCPHCKAEVQAGIRQCPICGQYLPRERKPLFSFKNLTPTEIFLLILGSVMLLIGVVAL